MRIGIVSSMRAMGGTENVSTRLCSLMRDGGHEVWLISGSGPLVEAVREKGVSWSQIDFYGGAIGYLLSTLRLGRLARQQRIEVLHCQMARPVIGCLMASLATGFRTKVIWHSRGLRARTYPTICRLFSALGVYAIANCRAEREKLLRHGYSAGRVTYTYNPLPLLAHAPSTRGSCHGRLSLGSLSRLAADRNVDEAIHILFELRRAGCDADLVIGGDGPEAPRLKQVAEQLGLSRYVHFSGRVTCLSNFFPNIDILVNPLMSKGDSGAGVGNNILESALYGVPVVAYDSCGINEMVLDGDTGYCVPIGDRGQFVARLQSLAHESEKRASMGAKLRDHVLLECSDRRIYQDILGAYEGALGWDADK